MRSRTNMQLRDRHSSNVSPTFSDLVRKAVAILLATIVAICLSQSIRTRSVQAEPANRPNIVLILSDDQAWTDYGFMGHKTIETPHLDRLAKESVVYTRGYVPTSLCRPSLMTLVTGLFPHQHGITGNDPPRGTDRQLMLKHVRQHPVLPRLLAQHGYLSFQSGKWWEGSYELGGFTHGMTHGDPRRGGRHGDLGLTIGRQGLQPIYDFIDGCGDQPFFLWYAPLLPHEPHNPPQRLLDKYARKVDSPFVARYFAMCEWFDETCGELLDHLDQRGLSENTLVVYVSDNGWIQQPDHSGFAPQSKRSPYDGGLRTPIMLRWPGKLKPRRDDQTLISSVDLVPTILSAAGLSATDEMPGLDLLTVSSETLDARDAIFGEIFEHDEVDIDDPASGLLYRWCIAGNWKLILPKDRAQPELYDLSDDPFEKRNLAADHAEVVSRLTKRLDDWWPAAP